MKFFLAEGRLGNQIFQYVYLKTIQNGKEKFIVSGFDELTEVFETESIINLKKNNVLMRNVIYRVINPLLTMLCKIKLISSVSVNYVDIIDGCGREAETTTTIRGLLKSITFVKLGFFQSEAFFDQKIAEELKVKNKYVAKASKFLDCIPETQNRIFIHIRRGDYINYRLYGKGTLLPLRYYKDQIEWFLSNKQNCFFIFLSDEPDFIEKEFSYLKNKIISTKNESGTDLAIMMQCANAILSPSSFGWWGSYWMKHRDTVIAPKYWLGFESKVEFHLGSVPSFAKKIDVGN